MTDEQNIIARLSDHTDAPPLTVRGLPLRTRVMTAPLCNTSDRPFRDIMRSMGAELVFTPMVSCEGLTRDDKGTWSILDNEGEASPVAVQLVGSNPQRMGESARLVTEHGNVQWIDINMGCPARHVTGNGNGSALMNTPELALEVMRAVRENTDLPLSVKMRSGWDDQAFLAPDLATAFQDAGADAIILHPRTRQQGYSGHSNWEHIRELRQLLHIPLIGNGDITSPADAVQMCRTTGCDGVMIGRGLMGNPWLLQACAQALDAFFSGKIMHEDEVPGDEMVYPDGNDDGTGLCIRQPFYMRDVPFDERLNLVIEHTRINVLYKGEHRGILEMRKHSQNYIKGCPGAKRMRERLMQITEFDELCDVFSEFRRHLCDRRTAERSVPFEPAPKTN